MSMNKFLFASMIMVGMSACSKDDVVSNGENVSEGNAYMALSISMPNANGSRAISGGNLDHGTNEEQKVSNLVIYVWGKDGKLTAAESYTENQLVPTKPNPSNTDKSTVYTTPAFKVKAGESKVVAIVNGATTISGKVLYDKNTMGKVGEGTFATNNLRTLVEWGNDAKTKVEKISTSNNFLMTNAFNIRNIDANGTPLTNVDPKDKNDYNFNLDGTVGVDIQGTKDNPTTVVVPVERVVAKLEESTKDYEKDVVKVNADGKNTTTTGDKVKFTHVALINGNKSFYPIKQVRANADNDYIVDGNFDNNKVEGNFVDNNFYATKFFDANTANKEAANIDWRDLSKAETSKLFYTLENTMIKDQQMNAYTTGLYYKAQYLRKGVTGNVYRFKGKLYNWDELSKDNDFPKTYVDETKTITFSDGSTVEEFALVGATKYVNGVCYYPYWIRHINNNNPSVMGEMEFGVVRNNWYKMTIGKVTGIGSNTPENPDPNTPDENPDTMLEVLVKVMPWTVRNNNIEF